MITLAKTRKTKTKQKTTTNKLKILTMKTQKPATSKLVASFDKELMNIIMSDLKALKAKNAPNLTAA